MVQGGAKSNMERRRGGGKGRPNNGGFEAQAQPRPPLLPSIMVKLDIFMEMY